MQVISTSIGRILWIFRSSPIYWERLAFEPSGSFPFVPKPLAHQPLRVCRPRSQNTDLDTPRLNAIRGFCGKISLLGRGKIHEKVPVTVIPPT